MFRSALALPTYRAVTCSDVTRTRYETEQDVTRILRALRALPPHDRDRRTTLLRSLGQGMVELREHFSTGNGAPDWNGRSKGYRDALHNAYAVAGYIGEDAEMMKKAASYHLAKSLRTRLSKEEIEALGQRPEDPAERQAAIRERNAAIVAAHTAIGEGANDERTPEAKLAAMQEALGIMKNIRIIRSRKVDPEVREAALRSLRAIADRAEDLMRQVASVPPSKSNG